MKHHQIPLTLLTLALVDLSVAQDPRPPVIIEERVIETVTPAPGIPAGVVTEEIVTEEIVTGAPAPGAFDPAFARRQLAIMPRDLPEPLPGESGTVVETTETTTTVETPGLPPRVYNVERNIVIVEGRELPYITLPVLFVKETAELLDSESRAALVDTAAAIKEIILTNPDAGFDIEGHTSTDGTDEFNMNLSVERARRVHQELTLRYGIPTEVLTAHGYGENFPTYPTGTEVEMMRDRRVLVVRVK